MSKWILLLRLEENYPLSPAEAHCLLSQQREISALKRRKKKENIEKDTKTLDWIYKLRKYKVQSRKLNDLCPFICYLFKSVLIRSPLVVSNGNPSKLVEGNKKAENYIDSLNTCTWLLENQTMGKRSLQESTTSM